MPEGDSTNGEGMIYDDKVRVPADKKDKMVKSGQNGHVILDLTCRALDLWASVNF